MENQDIWRSEETTIRELYAPAMEITDQMEADEYLARLIHRSIVVFGQAYEEAYVVQMSNLGYYAGYYSRDVAVRVQVLFGATHPIIPMGATPEEIFALGLAAATAV